MSAHNGDRARFHRNRKRRVLQRMRLRAMVLKLSEEKGVSTNAGGSPPPHPRKGGPAMEAN